MTGSREKCRTAIDAYLDQNYPMMAPLIAPQISLPATDEELDAELERYAVLFCALRSDAAAILEVRSTDAVTA